ncbi:hypothetical protein ACNPQJ_21600, partial [Acinetobacter bereziniae]
IGCTIDFRCRLLHLEIILLKKPSRIALCNKAKNKRKQSLFMKNILDSMFVIFVFYNALIFNE